jgi:hypothetical protein
MTARRWLRVAWVFACWAGPAWAASETLSHNPFKYSDLEAAAGQPEAMQSSAPGPAWEPELRGIMVAGKSSLVNIGGTILGIGEEIEGYRLVGVREHEAVFQKGGGKVVVAMPFIKPAPRLAQDGPAVAKGKKKKAAQVKQEEESSRWSALPMDPAAIQEALDRLRSQHQEATAMTRK